MTVHPGRLFSLAAMIAVYQIFVLMAVGQFPVGDKVLAMPYMLGQGVIVAWLLMLVYPPRLRGSIVYWILLMVLFFIFSVIDIFFLTFYSQLFNIMFLGAIIGSNPSESSEFIGNFMEPKLFAGILVLVAVVALVFFYARRLRATVKASLITLGSCMVAVTVLFSINPEVCASTSSIPVKGIIYFDYLRKCFVHDLERPEVHITPTGSEQPDNVVIIVGESHNRNHSGIYGYWQDTTPNLAKLQTDSLLLVFSDVEASDTHTIECFKTFMGTCDDAQSLDWYKQTTLIDVAQAAGYKVFWLSNQSKSGFFENPVVKFANTADRLEWSNGFSLDNRVKYDEVLLPMVTSAVEASGNNGKNLMICHLMGNHAAFKYRYPLTYEKFSPGMYGRYPKHQRTVRAEYDNSVLYTDYVVSEMMRTFDGRDAIVIYFSDHALDLFDTDPNYYEHAKPDNAASERASREIPFIVYATAEYQQRHPEMMARLRALRDKKETTSNLLYLVMEIIGVEFADQPTPQW